MPGIAPPEKLEFIHASLLRAEADWYMPPHTHTFHELILVHRGKIRVRLAGQEFIVGPGGILLYRAGISHEEWIHEEAPLLTVCLSFKGEGLAPDEPIMRRDIYGRATQIATWLAEEQEAYFPDAEPYRQTLFQGLMAEFFRVGAHEPNVMVDRVRAFIRKHMEGTFSLQDLAAEAGTSKFHFVRRYQAITGRTPMEDVRHLRVEEARRLILSTTLTLREIAPRVGVADEYHLSRLLKSHLGVSVRELRQSVRGNTNGLNPSHVIR